LSLFHDTWKSGLALAESHYDPNTRFGKIVVGQGILTPRDLWNGVRTRAEEIVRSLFSYSAGWIHFWEGEVEPDNVVRLALPTKRLIGEGLERRDELMCFQEVLEDGRTRIALAPDARPVVSESERAVMNELCSSADRAVHAGTRDHAVSAGPLPNSDSNPHGPIKVSISGSIEPPRPPEQVHARRVGAVRRFLRGVADGIPFGTRSTPCGTAPLRSVVVARRQAA